MRAVVVVGIVALLCGVTEARPKTPKRRGTFAAYIDPAVPADPPRPPRTAQELAADRMPDLAVVFVIERSTDYLDAAKALVRGAVRELGPNDFTAVIAVDSEAQVYVRPTRARNQARIDNDLSRLQRSGGTFLFKGLSEAYDQLQGIAARSKLIVLITDGDGPEDGIHELIGDFRASRIDMIAIGTNPGSRNMVTRMADTANGQAYFLDKPPAFKSLFDRRRLR